MAGQPLSLKARALQWLAQREHSRTELRRKLLRALQTQTRKAAGDGATTDERDRAVQTAKVEALLDELQAQGLLSEQRFIESRVHARAARFGNLRIRQELARHGTALDEATAATLRRTELQRARDVWQSKFGTAAQDAAGRARQARFLTGRGFSIDVVRRVVNCDDD